MSGEQERRIAWWECPTAYKPKRIMFLFARDAEHAKAKARDKIEREYQTDWFKFVSVEPYTKPE